MKNLYLAADGDDVGRKIEFFIVMDQLDLLSRFSSDFQSSITWFSEKLSNKFNAEIVFHGGDSILAKIQVDETSITELEKLRIEFFSLSNTTISLGLGDSSRQAYFALKLAKASGKNRIEIFMESVE